MREWCALRSLLSRRFHGAKEGQKNKRTPSTELRKDREGLLFDKVVTNRIWAIGGVTLNLRLFLRPEMNEIGLNKLKNCVSMQKFRVTYFGGVKHSHN